MNAKFKMKTLQKLTRCGNKISKFWDDQRAAQSAIPFLNRDPQKTNPAVCSASNS